MNRNVIYKVEVYDHQGRVSKQRAYKRMRYVGVDGQGYEVFESLTVKGLTLHSRAYLAEALAAKR